jgi:hypothetical protein
MDASHDAVELGSETSVRPARPHLTVVPAGPDVPAAAGENDGAAGADAISAPQPAPGPAPGGPSRAVYASSGRRRLLTAVAVILACLIGAAFLVGRQSTEPPADPPAAGRTAGGPGARPDEGSTTPTSPEPAVDPATPGDPAPPPSTGASGDQRGPGTSPSPSTPGGQSATTVASAGDNPGHPAEPDPPAGPGDVVPPADPPAASDPPLVRDGTVNGCNTYSEDCDGVPLYPSVPPPGYDYLTFPHATTVPNGTVLGARCWTRGGVTYNYAAFFDPPDYGPDPYGSDIYYLIPTDAQALWIADTYFVRDKSGYGLPPC